jgi:hypothetical protein
VLSRGREATGRAIQGPLQGTRQCGQRERVEQQERGLATATEARTTEAIAGAEGAAVDDRRERFGDGSEAAECWR